MSREHPARGSADDLKEKRVIVTAGAAGIGLTITRAFCDRGARVHICDVDAQALAAAIDLSPRISGTLADVSAPEQVDGLMRDAERRLGGLDILVNNAGTAGPTGEVENISVDGWRETLAVNLDGQFYCTRRAVPLLKRERGGSIINMSSTAGLYGYPSRTPYAAAKWGVIGLTKTLAMELGKHGIRVNAICPGSVEGERIDQVIAREAEMRGVSADRVRRAYQHHTSMRTFVRSEDVAQLVLFLCSDAGARISGQALGVDGHTETLGEPITY